ncbi:peptide-methionine (S)-S-oxide reductase MsrA [Gemmatimonas sp.]|uniref:peptide-methionine (S)-S-oxide reductase MsrA n=1 Tax=Gemmatimonas sp. TaxID=1962908 RepID=UPI0035656955
MRLLLVPFALSLALVGCGPSDTDTFTERAPSDEVQTSASASVTSGTTADIAMDAPSVGMSAKPASRTMPPAAVDTAIFAGGCFWCMEPPYDKLDGVLSTTSGYTSGSVVNPTYEQVSAGGTGHTEAMQVVFDPSRVTYDRLLHVFWRNIDPFARNQQFCDRGSQYRSGIYPRTALQTTAAETSLRALAARFSQPIATEIVAATRFYSAEEYHQDYYMKNPVRYKFYRASCGRDKRLEEIWGDEAGK